MRVTHAYPARRLDDGTYEIANVDIFETCSRTHPISGELTNFDVAWLEAAAATAAEQEAAGYYPPVHLGHHPIDATGSQPPSFAGFLRDLRVERTGSDNAHAVLRATISGIPVDVFDAIAVRRLPYRSVEIHDPATPAISSLALLDTVVPFFKFPITNVALDEADTVVPDDPEDEDEPVVTAVNAGATAFAEREGSLHAVAIFQAKPLIRNAEPTIASGPTNDPIAASLAKLQSMVASLAELPSRVQSLETALAQFAADTATQASTQTIDRQLDLLAAEGYVFDANAVRELLAANPQPATAVLALKRVLPRAPIDAFQEGEDGHDASSPHAADVVASLLRELGREADPTLRRAAREAAAEYERLSTKFSSIGCSFDKADFIRARIAPITFDVAGRS